jgi:hypothetical protein
MKEGISDSASSPVNNQCAAEDSTQDFAPSDLKDGKCSTYGIKNPVSN